MNNKYRNFQGFTMLIFIVLGFFGTFAFTGSLETELWWRDPFVTIAYANMAIGYLYVMAIIVEVGGTKDSISPGDPIPPSMCAGTIALLLGIIDIAKATSIGSTGFLFWSFVLLPFVAGLITIVVVGRQVVQAANAAALRVLDEAKDANAS